MTHVDLRTQDLGWARWVDRGKWPPSLTPRVISNDIWKAAPEEMTSTADFKSVTRTFPKSIPGTFPKARAQRLLRQDQRAHRCRTETSVTSTPTGFGSSPRTAGRGPGARACDDGPFRSTSCVSGCRACRYRSPSALGLETRIGPVTLSVWGSAVAFPQDLFASLVLSGSVCWSSCLTRGVGAWMWARRPRAAAWCSWPARHLGSVRLSPPQAGIHRQAGDPPLGAGTARRHTLGSRRDRRGPLPPQRRRSQLLN